MPIKIAQSSSHADKGRWRWSVWLDGAAGELDSIEYVTYTLHSTFSDPVRRIGDRETAFRLDSEGWGEFNIHAAVHFRDDRVQQLDHWLTLYSDVDQWLKRAGGSFPHVVPRRAQRPRIYLSYSVADAFEIQPLVRLLGQAGVEVTTSDDIAETRSGMSFDQTVRTQLQAVSGAVFIISRSSNPRHPWLLREMEMAVSLAIPVAFITATDTPFEHIPHASDIAKAIACLVRRDT